MHPHLCWARYNYKFHPIPTLFSSPEPPHIPRRFCTTVLLSFCSGEIPRCDRERERASPRETPIENFALSPPSQPPNSGPHFQLSGLQERFQVVVGSDVIYYEEDAEALASTVVRSTEPGGKFIMMNKAGRPGLETVGFSCACPPCWFVCWC